MRHFLLLLIIALVVASVAYGVAWLLTGRDNGLEDSEPDGRAVPLPGTRPLVEPDISAVRFDTGIRGYRMDQVDAAMRRAAYDVGYKGELINVLEAEIQALRDGRTADAETLRRAREGAQLGVAPPPGSPGPVAPIEMRTDGGTSAGPADPPTGAGDTPTGSGDTLTGLGEPVTRAGDGPGDETLIDEPAVPAQTDADADLDEVSPAQQAPSGR